MGTATQPTFASPATLADLLAVPEEQRVELIGGIIVDRAAPSFDHGQAQGGITESVRPTFGRPPGGGSSPGGWWIGSEILVGYTAKDVFRHDVVGWKRASCPTRPSGAVVFARPDWACEILSPSNWANDTVRKFRALETAGVPYYWVVDIEHGVLTVYGLVDGHYYAAAFAEPGQVARLAPFEAVEFDTSILFGLDPQD